MTRWLLKRYQSFHHVHLGDKNYQKQPILLSNYNSFFDQVMLPNYRFPSLRRLPLVFVATIVQRQILLLMAIHVLK